MTKISRSLASVATVLALIVGSLAIPTPAQAALSDLDVEGNGIFTFSCYDRIDETYNTLTSGTYTVSGFELTEISSGEISGVSLGCMDISVTIDDRVTSIGPNVLENRTLPTALSFSESSQLVSIDSGAFEGATGLSAINGLPEGLTTIGERAFKGASALSSIRLRERVTAIGDSAFEGATGITEIFIAGGVTTLGDSVFSGASGLTNVDFGYASVITSIGPSAFKGASSLESINIPKGVTTIGDSAFFGASALTSVNFGSATLLDSVLTSIGPSAFKGASSLESINIPKGVTTIGADAFSGASALASVTFLSVAAPTVGANAFAGVDAAATAYISPIETGFLPDGQVWNNLLVSKLGGFGCSTRGYVVQTGTEITSHVDCAGTAPVPSGVTAIGPRAFRYNTNLLGISFPATLTSIERLSFEGASSLATVTFAPGSLLTEIDSYAFNEASALTSIVIPSGVRKITGQAFGQTTSLATVTFEAGSVLEGIEDSAFRGSSLSSITLPESLEYIRDRAFYGTQLTTITIPSNVDDLGERIFGSTPLLMSINVDQVDNYYSSVDGVLFNGSNELVAYPAGRINTAYQVPARINNIWSYAFSGATYLETIDFASQTNYFQVQSRDFSDIPNLEQLLLPNSVAEIAGLAFSGSESIVNLAVPANVTSISTDSFAGMESLRKLGFLGNAPTYRSGDEDANLTFQSSAPMLFRSSTATGFGEGRWKGLAQNLVDYLYCSVSGYAVVYLTVLVESQSCNGQVTIPRTVTEIYPSAFQNEHDLTAVIFEPTSSLTKIGTSAFASAHSLETITIPASVTEIGMTAFAACLFQKAINVEVANNNYSSRDGVLFNKDQTQLINYPPSKTLTRYAIPSTVTHVAKMAFYEARNLTSMQLPAGLDRIDELGLANTSISNFRFDGNAPDVLGENAFLGSPDGAQASVSISATGFGVGELWNSLSVQRVAIDSPSRKTIVATPMVSPKQIALRKVVAELLQNGVPVLKGTSASKRVLFTGLSSKLDATDLAILSEVASSYKGQKGKLVLVGFVQENGQSKTTAKKLSTTRAKRVANALVQLGVDFEIEYAGFGSRNKLKPKTTDNRVEIRWVAAE